MSVNHEGAGFPFQATTATPSFADGQVVRASVDPSDGGLRVHLQNGSTGGTSATDNSTFTAGSSSGTPEMGAFDDAATVLSSGKLAIQRITAYRAGHINVRNSSGTEVGTLAAAFRIDPTGGTPQPVTQSGVWAPYKDSASIYVAGVACTPKFAAISASSSGNNTIVSAVSSKKIRVIAFNFIANAAVNAKWQSGAGGTDLTGLYYLAANGGISAPLNDYGYFETASNTLLNLNLSGAVAVGGVLTYIEV